MTVQTVTAVKFSSILTGMGAGFYRFTARTDAGLTFTGIVSRDMPGEAWEARYGDLVAHSTSRKRAVADVMAQALPSCDSVETVEAFRKLRTA